MLYHNVCNKLEIFAMQYFRKEKTSVLQRVNINHHFVTFKIRSITTEVFWCLVSVFYLKKTLSDLVLLHF